MIGSITTFWSINLSKKKRKYYLEDSVYVSYLKRKRCLCLHNQKLRKTPANPWNPLAPKKLDENLVYSQPKSFYPPCKGWPTKTEARILEMSYRKTTDQPKGSSIITTRSKGTMGKEMTKLLWINTSHHDGDEAFSFLIVQLY